MTLKLYGSAMSTSRVLVTILELNLPYELVLVDIAKGEQKSEDYRKLQPFGKVPALEDNGFFMFESRAICKYLAKKYASKKGLMPDADDRAYGRFEQACSVEQSYFGAAAETIGTEMIIKPMKGLGAPDEGRVAEAESALETVLGVYDRILATQKYLCGDEISLADLFHLPNGAALMAGKWKETFQRYPNADRWFKGLQQRETWLRAAAESGTFP
ncbi:thioredoxin-like protein [Westerdykella ornata]|uniref:glutathione transferase n=1 Tax=Westerdykella ornata TaxID=318751 RepID=A0A6A6JB07_WESOR|nr:thioredoxin-like protein [Westerdykella ornata]KAF2273800.1 thioredoxin-like protein [Westerdykella ornata]